MTTQVGSALRRADELRGGAAARSFARDGGGEVDNVVIQRCLFLDELERFVYAEGFVLDGRAGYPDQLSGGARAA